MDTVSPIGAAAGTFDAVSMIYSTFNNLEVVARINGTELAHFYRDQASGTWYGPTPIGNGVSGTPSFIQSKSGNFEVVTPLAAGGLAHYTRVGNTWGPPKTFAPGQVVSAVSLIQNTAGDLEVVANIGSQLDHYWSASTSGSWTETGVFANQVSGTPSLVQASSADFEVVAPLANGGMAQYVRSSSNPAGLWAGPMAQFGSGNVLYLSASMIQSGYGNLEVVARSGACSVEHYYHQGQWSGPTTIVP